MGTVCIVKYVQLELGMCMIIGKHDIYRIPEIITYHNLIGVGKFFIYYNFKEDELKENYRHFFEPFVKSGLVVLVPFDLNTKKYIDGIQLLAYQDCLYKAKGIVKWLAFSDADEFFLLKPSFRYHSLVDFLKSHQHYTSCTFRTFMVGNEGNVSDFFSNKNIKNDTLFLNEWLLFKDEHKLRPPKTIYKTDENDYVGVHMSPIHKKSIFYVSWHNALLGHYRYPYKEFTIKGIQNGTYKQNNSFKSLYGKKILEKLRSFGFSNNFQ